MSLLLDIMLTGKEVELDHVKNLAMAEAYLEEKQPSLVLLDNKLPDGFGIDFISVLKKKYPSVKVAIISGFDGAAKDVALDNGADVYLQKPFTCEELSNSVKVLLS